jgi:hypothetical protein
VKSWALPLEFFHLFDFFFFLQYKVFNPGRWACWVNTYQKLYPQPLFDFFFFPTQALRFELRASHLLGRHTWTILPDLFHVGCLWDKVLQTVCLGWLQTSILLSCQVWVTGTQPNSNFRWTLITGRSECSLAVFSWMVSSVYTAAISHDY